VKRSQPVRVFFCYDSESTNCVEVAQEVYSAIYPKPNGYSDSFRHVPIFMYSNPEAALTAIKIMDSISTIVFLFIDGFFILNKEWKHFIEDISSNKDSLPVIVPIAFHSNFLVPFPSIRNLNAIRAFEFGSNKIEKIKFLIIYKIALIINNINEGESRLSIKLFLSYAKNDGRHIAIRIRRYIDDNTTLTRFLDENDIPSGIDFMQVIEEQIIDSVLLVILSDSYSSRNYCRQEVLLAKRHHRIIIVLDALAQGEERSFPYLGNVKTIRYKQRINYYNLFFTILSEFSRRVYYQLSAEFLIRFTSQGKKKYELDSYPPELLSVFHDGKSANRTIIYPDPPLSNQEMQLLERATKKKFMTPTLLQLQLGRYFFSLSKVICSVSVSEVIDNKMDNISDFIYHLLFELTRYLFTCGGQIVYGGRIYYPEEYNFLQYLFDLSKAYSEETSKEPRVINYYIFDKDIPQDPYELAKFTPLLEFRKAKCIIGKDCLKSNAHAQKSRSISLSILRAEVMSCAKASIFAGGKMLGFKGMLPGIIEEFTFSIDKGNPVFIVGGFGGAAEVLANLYFKSKKKKAIDYISHTIDMLRVKNYNEYAKRFGIDEFNVTERILQLSSLRLSSLNNGLTTQENIILMSTTNVKLIVALVIKGLTTIYKNTNES